MNVLLLMMIENGMYIDIKKKYIELIVIGENISEPLSGNKNTAQEKSGAALFLFANMTSDSKATKISLSRFIDLGQL